MGKNSKVVVIVTIQNEMRKKKGTKEKMNISANKEERVTKQMMDGIH